MTQQIIDTSVFCGYWAFRALSYRTPAALKQHLQAAGVGQAWVAAPEAVLYPDPMQANEPFLATVASDPYWLPVAVIDPSLPGWEADVRRCMQLGARALKLTPNYHEYKLSDSCAAELAELAVALRLPVCVQVRMLDERSHHPLMKVPGVPPADIAAYAQSHPAAAFLACGCFMAESKLLRPDTANLWVELSHMETVETLHQALQNVSPDRLVFGSHSPFLYMSAVLAKLHADLTMTPAEQVAAVRAANALSLLAAAERGGAPAN